MESQGETERSTRSGLMAALLLTGGAVALRLLTLPLEAYQAKHWLRWRESQQQARAAYQLLVGRRGARGTASSAITRDPNATLAALQRLALQRCDTARWKAFIPWGRMVSIPAFLTTALKVRQMALQGEVHGTVPGLWLTDLAAPDPFYILPISNALLMLRNLEYNFPLMPWSDHGKRSDSAVEISPQQRWLQSQSLKVLLQGAVLMITPGVVGLPSAVLLFWLTNSCVQATLSAAWWRDRWNRWIRQSAFADLQTASAKRGSIAAATATQTELHLEQALHQAAQEIQWIRGAVAGVTAHRPVTPSLLKQVEFELHRWRANGRLQLPWRAALRESTPGRRVLALYLEHASSATNHQGSRPSDTDFMQG